MGLSSFYIKRELEKKVVYNLKRHNMNQFNTFRSECDTIDTLEMLRVKRVTEWNKKSVFAVS